jgi:hypothetical protein
MDSDTPSILELVDRLGRLNSEDELQEREEVTECLKQAIREAKVEELYQALQSANENNPTIYINLLGFYNIYGCVTKLYQHLDSIDSSDPYIKTDLLFCVGSEKYTSWAQEFEAQLERDGVVRAETNALSTCLQRCPDSAYLMSIDGQCFEDGKTFLFVQTYDNREPGCVNRMVSALGVVSRCREARIDSRFLCQLHSMATTGLRREVAAGGILEPMPTFYSGRFRAADVPDNGFAIKMAADQVGLYDAATATEKGVVELKKRFCKEIVSSNSSDMLTLRGWRAFLKQNTKEYSKAVAGEVSKVLERYNHDIESCRDDEERLRLIARTVQDLEFIHPFKDGNCRVICVLLLNTLLIQNALRPTILFNPNRFDGCDIGTLVRDIRTGQALVSELLGRESLDGWICYEGTDYEHTFTNGDFTLQEDSMVTDQTPSIQPAFPGTHNEDGGFIPKHL